jgi:hypothetical protein
MFQKLGIYLTIFTLIFYNFHRYIFKYNSESTSPTYTNTPIVWQISKYILILFFTSLFYFGSKFKFVFNKNFLLIYCTILFVIFTNIIAIFYYRNLSSSVNELEYCFYFIVLMPLWFTENNLESIDINYHKIINITGIALFISNAHVILNYFLFGRLPALGYEGDLVRFGGYWDDPNGFGFISVILAFYFLFNKSYFLLFAALVSIIMTFSFTAYFMLFISAIFWVCKYFKQINVKIMFYAFVIAVFLVYQVLENWAAVSLLLESKNGSVNQHLSNDLIFNPYPLANSNIQFSETWYLSFIYNYFPYSIFFIILILILFFWSIRGKSQLFFKYIIFIFLMYSLFLPMYYVFPINFIFIVLLTTSLKYRQKEVIAINYSKNA